MRPYLALIKDSFRAAFASRVLYVLLLIITVLLLVLIPLHVRETLDWYIKQGSHVDRADELAIRLVEQGEDDNRPQVKRIWGLFSDGLKKDLKEWKEELEAEDPPPPEPGQMPHEYRTANKLIKELNEIVKQKDFYRAEDWNPKRFSSELEGYVDEGVDNLSQDHMRRMNRLLISSAVNPLIENGEPTSLLFCYGWKKFEGWTVTSSPQQFAQTTTSTLTYVFDKFVLSIGLLIAILVTANIIPETFAPGSLNLLLSKPISRWGLLLAKFIGGCAFVSLCALYLFVGIWLWLGFALGIWDKGILYGIPVYILVFAIYYSVSTLVGIWWRSPILSIVITAIFWAACFGVGMSHLFLKNRMNNQKINRLISTEEGLFQVGEMNNLYAWDEESSNWEKELEIELEGPNKAAIGLALFLDESDVPPALGPEVDPKTGKMMMGMIDFVNPATMNYQELFVSEPGKTEFKKFGKLPRDTVALLPDPDGLIVVKRSGQFLRFDPAMKDVDSADSKRNEPFVNVGPNKKVPVRRARSISFNPKTRDIFVYRYKKITAFRKGEDGNYVRRAEVELDVEAKRSMSALIHSGGDSLVVALGNGQTILLDANTLEEKLEYRPKNESAVASIEASPDGRYFAMTYLNKTLWVLDTEDKDQIKKANVAGQGTISCAHFDADGKLWVADRTDRATAYDLSNNSRVATKSPKGDLLKNVYRYGLDPFYKLCPKPGEFYKVVMHLSDTAEDSEETEVDFRRASTWEDPWRPLWTGALFMGAMLLIAGLIFNFRDF